MKALEVQNASIRYITGDFKDIGLKEYVMRRLTHNYFVTEFWANRNVSFSLEKGDMLGIIGSNGAGKSTLLKAISGIMEPTHGSVRREGSVAALLELGSGFDGDLTVRENTYLRGAMLGYTRKFMDETYDSIIEFAELQNFQDRPFKQLSSGMQSRLAFSIASLVRPDILILDEVLSVGDGAFRKKSEEKMKEIIHGGATTILVSHSLDQVREMCNKVLWLHKGEQIAFGDDVQGICDQYEAFLAGGSEKPKYCARNNFTSPIREEPVAPVGLDINVSAVKKETACETDVENIVTDSLADQGIEEANGMHRTKRWKPLLECVLAICLLVAVIYTGYLIFAKLNPYGLDSDVVNEISYRQASWEQKSLFPDGFVCASESLSIRLILLYWLFYGITNNFLLSFQLENMCSFILELAAIYYLMKKLSIRNEVRLVGLLMFVVFLPSDVKYVNFWPDNPYVMFVIAIVITLALRISLRKAFWDSPKVINKSTIGVIMLIFIIAAYCGYGSIKMMLFLYLPLLVLDWSKIILRYVNRLPQDPVNIRLGLITIATLIVNLFSYVIFSHIHPNNIVEFSFGIAEVGKWFSWDIWSTNLRVILECFGITGSGLLSSLSGVRFLCSCFIAFIGIASVAWLLLKKSGKANESKETIWYWFFVTLAVAAFHIVVGVPTTPRYYCMTAVMLPVLCSLAINDWMSGENGKTRLLPCITFLLGILCLFCVNVKVDSVTYSSNPPELTQVATFVEDNGYKYVTASYWNADVIKGYTNGRVDSQHSDPYGGFETLSPFFWLTDKNKYSDEKQGVPNILLLTDEEETMITKSAGCTAIVLNDYAKKVAEIGGFNLYALTENPYMLIEKVKQDRQAGLPTANQIEKVDLPFYTGFEFTNATLNEGELVSDGDEGGFILWGPYTETIAGRYNITLNYVVESFTDSKEGSFDTLADLWQIAIVPFTSEQTSVTLENIKIEDGHRFEVRVWIPDGMVIRVQSITYQRIE